MDRDEDDIIGTIIFSVAGILYFGLMFWLAYNVVGLIIELLKRLFS